MPFFPLAQSSTLKLYPHSCGSLAEGQNNGCMYAGQILTVTVRCVLERQSDVVASESVMIGVG